MSKLRSRHITFRYPCYERAVFLMFAEDNSGINITAFGPGPADGVQWVFIGLETFGEMIDHVEDSPGFGRDTVQLIEESVLVAGRVLVPFNVEFADGVKVAGGGGLTGAGRELIALAEALGVVVDVSHLGPAGFSDVMAMAVNPVVASHANARAVCDHPRNLDDDQIRTLASRGGVIGVNLYPPFLSAGSTASTEDVVRHLAHLLHIAGPQAVGLGLDFDGIEATPVDLPDITSLPRLVAAIDHLGLTPAEQTAVLGGNWLRVFRQILP